MSEVISTRFEANASEFVREVNKARDGVKRLSATELPLMQSEMDRAFVQSQKMSKGIDGLGAASKRSGANMLVLAQVADDAQYGFRGIANQIPQLVQSLGAGAGLAGAISLASLASYKLGPGLLNVLGFTNNTAAGIAALNKEVNTLIVNFNKQTAVIKEQQVAQEALNASREKQEATIKKLSGGPQVAIAENEISRMKQQVVFADQLLEARAKLAKISSEGAAAQGGIERNLATQKSENEVKALEAEISRRKALASELGNQQAENISQTSNETVEIIKQKNAQASLIEKLEKQISLKKLQADGANAIIEGLKKEGMVNSSAGQIDYSKTIDPLTLAVKNIGYLYQGGGKNVDLGGVEQAGKDAVAAAIELEKKLAAAKQEASRLELLQKKITTGTEASQNAYEEQLRFQGKSTEELQKQLSQQLELKTITDQILKAETEKAIAAEQAAQSAKKEQEAKKAAAEAQRISEEAAKAAEKAAAQKGVRGDFSAELSALKLQAAGREKEAQALRDKVRLTKEAQELAKEAGITEAQAQQLVLQKFQLEKAINKEKENGKKSEQSDGRIRLFRRGESAGGVFANSAQVGLRSSVIEKNVRIAEQRDAARRSNQKDKPTTQLDDILAVNKSLLNFWTTNIKAV